MLRARFTAAPPIDRTAEQLRGGFLIDRLELAEAARRAGHETESHVVQDRDDVDIAQLLESAAGAAPRSK
jgi:hypothetical protein